MNYLGFASPFTMSSSQFDDEAAFTDDSLSPSSSQSSASYISFDSVPLPPTAEDEHSPAPYTADLDFALEQDSASPPASTTNLIDNLLPPLSPPANSFASAQAAMAAQNSSHSQNLIGHCLDNSSVGFTSTLEFISILGLGAYGVVYLARDIAARPSAFPSSRAHPQLGNQPLYAVKCLNKVGLDERQRNFQRREIRLHSNASKHGNVVTLHNVIDEETCIYVVLQFCEEGDLFGMITERQRYLGDDELIRSVFLQIVDSVEYCHSQEIYHRDLKPENILCLDDGKKVVLADFGLATHEKTSGDFGCGSTFYMSPGMFVSRIRASREPALTLRPSFPQNAKAVSSSACPPTPPLTTTSGRSASFSSISPAVAIPGSKPALPTKPSAHTSAIPTFFALFSPSPTTPTASSSASLLSTPPCGFRSKSCVARFSVSRLSS